MSVTFSGSAGLACGEWLSFGSPDLPNDQRSVAQYHACWTSPPLTQSLHILGRATVDLDCALDTEEGQVYTALCHVMNSEGGGFRLLTYGLLNLSGKKRQVVRVEMDAIGYSVPPGDSLLVMVSPGSFPTSWPSPNLSTLSISAGSLSLPTTDLHSPRLENWFSRPDLSPRLGPTKEVEVIRADNFTREVRAGLSDSMKTVTTDTDEGCKYFPDVDTIVEERSRDVYTINGDDPLSAEAYCYRDCIIIYQVQCHFKLPVTDCLTIVTPGEEGTDPHQDPDSDGELDEVR